MKHHPQAILFDWDNTLVASTNALYNAMNHTLAQFDKPLMSGKQIYQNTHQTPQDSFIELFGTCAAEARNAFYKFINAMTMEERFTPLPGAQTLLEKIKLLGIPMGIVSNKQSANLHAEIHSVGWASYFHAIIGSGDATDDKPSPAPLNLALTRMNLQASPNIWFIGDSPVDWACAQQGGCQPFSIHVVATDPSIFNINDLTHLGDIIDGTL